MGRKGEHTAERTCIVTRRTCPREVLLRFVRAPDGTVVFDLKGDLPGRGAWVAPSREVLEEAVRRNAFARAFKAASRVPADLPEQVEWQLKEALLATLSLARRAGEAVAGFEKVREWLRAGDVAVLLEAKDGAQDGREKILSLARAVAPAAALVETLDSAELGLAFGRERVIHAAMKPGGLARKVLRLSDKLRGLAAAGAGRRDEGPERETERNGQ